MFPVLSTLKKKKSGPSYSLLDFSSGVCDLIPFLSIKTALTDFLGGSGSKEPDCNAVDPGSSPAFGRFSWRRHWEKNTPVFLPGEFHGQRSMMGYSPWGRKERLTLSALDVQPSWCWVQREILWQSRGRDSSTLDWKIPWTEEPGRLQSTGSQRVGHD